MVVLSLSACSIAAVSPIGLLKNPLSENTNRKRIRHIEDYLYDSYFFVKIDVKFKIKLGEYLKQNPFYEMLLKGNVNPEQIIEEEKIGFGSSFLIFNNAQKNKSFLLTNEHVCDIHNRIKNVIEKKVTIHICTKENICFISNEIASNKKQDLCLLQSKFLKNKNIVYISKRPAKKFDTVYNSALSGAEMIAISEGRIRIDYLPLVKGMYYGTAFFSLDGEKTKYLRSAFNWNAYGGNSGSPIINEYGELVSVLNSGSTTQDRTFGITHREILEFLNTNRKNFN